MSTTNPTWSDWVPRIPDCLATELKMPQDRYIQGTDDALQNYVVASPCFPPLLISLFILPVMCDRWQFHHQIAIWQQTKVSIEHETSTNFVQIWVLLWVWNHLRFGTYCLDDPCWRLFFCPGLNLCGLRDQPTESSWAIHFFYFQRNNHSNNFRIMCK